MVKLSKIGKPRKTLRNIYICVFQPPAINGPPRIREVPKNPAHLVSHDLCDRGFCREFLEIKIIKKINYINVN